MHGSARHNGQAAGLIHPCSRAGTQGSLPSHQNRTITASVNSLSNLLNILFSELPPLLRSTPVSFLPFPMKRGATMDEIPGEWPRPSAMVECGQRRSCEL